MIRTSTLACALPTLLAVAGCSTIDFDNGDSRILGADDRIVVTKQNNDQTPREAEFVYFDKGVQITYSEEVGSNVDRFICAEPSPDVVKVKGGSGSATGGYSGVTAGLSGAYGESAASIGLRTGAIQILRDLEFRACEALMNGVVGAPAYARIIGGIAPTTLGLVAIEGLTKAPAGPAAVVTYNAPSTNSTTNVSREGQDGKNTRTGTSGTGTGAAGDKAAADKQNAASVSPSVLLGNPQQDRSLASKATQLAATEDKAATGKTGDTPSPINDSVARAVVQIVCLAGVATPSTIRGETAAQAIDACSKKF